MTGPRDDSVCGTVGSIERGEPTMRSDHALGTRYFRGISAPTVYCKRPKRTI